MNVGQSATFSAAAGNGSFTWSAPGGSPGSGSGSSFSDSYASAGSDVVTVTSNGQNATCSVTVLPAVSCSPASQTVNTGQTASFTAAGGNGSYNWSAPGGSPASGSGSSFSDSYASAGSDIVTVTSNGQNATCSVTVNAVAAVTCSPASQTVNVGQTATFSAAGGDGTYSWSAPGGSPASGSGSSFSDSYASAGSDIVTVTSNGRNATCPVTVNALPVAPIYGGLGGGIKLLVNGQMVDSVRWRGPSDSGPTDALGFGGWKGPALPAGSVQPDQCSGPPASNCNVNPNAYNALLRASRRGEISASNSTFVTPTGPADSNNNLWGPAYDTGIGTASVASWVYHQSPPVPPLRTSANRGFFSRLATPTPGTVAQVYDTVSSTNALALIASATDPHYTAQFRITGIAGPDAGGPSSWPMAVAAGTYQTPSNFNAISINGPITGTPLSLLNYVGAPPGPPQACTGGACDTDQAATNLYGANPDQYVPYLALNTQGNSDWCVVTGTVFDPSNNPLPGIPVSVSHTGNKFPAFEKTTNANGFFTILVPTTGNGNLSFGINDQNAVGTVPQNTHYYNPHYQPLDIKNKHITVGAPGQVIDLGTAVGQPLQLAVSPPANPITFALGTLTGQVTSAESNGATGLNGITLELRNPQGYVLLTATSNVNGNYTFSKIPIGTYLVSPVVELRETATPVKGSLVTLPAGGSVGAGNFQIRGVPAVVIASSTVGGTFVAVYKNDTTIGAQPPMFNPQLSLPIYTAVIPGGVAGAAYFSPSIAVPPGQIYSFVCWKPNFPSPSYTQGPVGSVNGGAAVSANVTYTVGCP